MRITEKQLRRIIIRSIRESYSGREVYGPPDDPPDEDEVGDEDGDDVYDVSGGPEPDIKDIPHYDPRIEYVPKTDKGESRFSSEEQMDQIKEKIWSGVAISAGRKVDMFQDFQTYLNYFKNGYKNDPEYQTADSRSRSLWDLSAARLVDTIYRITD